ncbi:hypothetical protein L226DRAFT_536249 [Lentinus tigrinus ALCF2SS1-7]|uniref:Uncharacterized protein n=1 Tax=Lentinus tigrinus ALCF2SS1-6 TaxID=1328759 RepID=A0A5C2S7N6_9APHY|nr:hypothetical protein L227DRAFT_576457 [Lentinus tigrinus ALCF2SS1-6]RPD73562.1 hypothetical protein L226DRAFT_536249 [Lentinus tigrinus ALCF2SS1-7]
MIDSAGLSQADWTKHNFTCAAQTWDFAMQPGTTVVSQELQLLGSSSLFRGGVRGVLGTRTTGHHKLAQRSSSCFTADWFQIPQKMLWSPRRLPVPPSRFVANYQVQRAPMHRYRGRIEGNTGGLQSSRRITNRNARPRNDTRCFQYAGFLAMPEVISPDLQYPVCGTQHASDAGGGPTSRLLVLPGQFARHQGTSLRSVLSIRCNTVPDARRRNGPGTCAPLLSPRAP